MSMTDEAAKKIAESTVKKYDDAGRNVLIFVGNNNNTSADVCSNMNGYGAVEAALALIHEIAGDLTETIFKGAAKEAKQLRKTKEKNVKH